MALKPVLIRLPEELLRRLKQEKKETGASVQFIIRRQLEAHYAKPRKVKRG